MAPEPIESARFGNRSYKWYILTLAALTATLVVAMPAMCMPVLFAEISEDLDLSLVQIGAIWGTGSLAGLFTGLVGGSLGDRFGTKRTLTVVCVLVGAAGALRGLAGDFTTLVATIFLGGLLGPVIPLSLHKICGVWFSKRRLGLANGGVAAGMAFGFMTGSMISATVLSPRLGGWRNVLFFYGAVSIAVSVPWALSRAAPPDRESPVKGASGMSMRRALAHVIRLRSLWLLGFAMLGVGGCIQGTLGYLPLYLREIGWLATRADGALAAFHAASLISVIPIALVSDRLAARKRILMIATLMIACGVGLLSIADGALVWVAVLLAGVVRDGYMAVFMTLVIEQEGVGAAYAGTAVGLTSTLSKVGGLLSPPLGNSLAAIDPGLPFVFWTAMAAVALLCFYFVKEGGRESRVEL